MEQNDYAQLGGDKKSNHLLHIFKDVFSSIVGSAACVYTGQPFDTVKVRMQVKTGEYRSAFECFRKTFQAEGVTALWRGSMPAFTGALLENAMAFGTNGVLKRLIANWEMDSNSNSLPIICGGFTGFCSAFVLCPCDVVKCRAQVLNMSAASSTTKRHTIATVLKEIMQRKGLRGLYTGMNAQLLRDIPFYASFFGSYEILCRGLRAHTDWSDTSVYLVAGGISGQIGWLASIAPDSIKSRIQASDQTFTIRQVFKDILQTRGWAGFFVGLEVAIVRAFPANAALFVGYELTKELFESKLFAD